jgi:hypothetical protein
MPSGRFEGTIKSATKRVADAFEAHGLSSFSEHGKSVMVDAKRAISRGKAAQAPQASYSRGTCRDPRRPLVSGLAWTPQDGRRLVGDATSEGKT